VSAREVVSLFLLILLSCTLGWVLGASAESDQQTMIQVHDQRACGADRTEAVWTSRGHRLVVCETPSGLVVREVTP